MDRMSALKIRKKSMVKELERVQVPADKIQMGMYVTGLDRPWKDSPFLLQGFVVSSPKVLEKLRNLCSFVYVDSKKSLRAPDADSQVFSPIGDGTAKNGKASRKDPYRASKKKLPINKDRYVAKPQMTSSEMRTARESYKDVQKTLSGLLQGISENSLADQKYVDKASGTLVSSAISYPSSLSWLALIQKHNNKIYDHALRASTWAVLCGRHIGLSESDLKWLAIGTMLKDIGKIRSMLKKAEEQSSSKAQAQSIDIAKLSKLNKNVIEVIAHHRERFNGTGKPRGLEGEEIPLLARIATIATAYDLSLNPLSKDREPMSPSQAARMIYTQRGRAFQDELAIQFIEALGTYPLGTILQLDTGEVAVVVGQDDKHRLKPRIIVVTDEAGQLIENKRIANLGKAGEGDKGEYINAKVMRDLSFSSIELNMADLLEEYDRLKQQSETSRAGRFFKRLFIGR